MLTILWKRGEIAPEEQFLLLSTIFCYLMLDSLSPDPFFAFLFCFLFVRDTNLAYPIKKLFTSLPCLKRKGLYTNVTDPRQNSADRPFNLSPCGF